MRPKIEYYFLVKFLLLSFIIFIAGMLTMVPWSTLPMQTASGDPAYIYVAHELFSRGSSCAEDLVCIGGPWSIWYWHSYHPGTYFEVILSHIFITGIIILSVIYLLIRNIKSTIAILMLALGIVGVLSADLDSRMFLLYFLFLFYFKEYIQSNKYISLLLIILAMGFSYYVKAPFLIASVSIVFLATLVEVFVLRKAPLVLIGYIVSLALFAQLSGHSFQDVPIFLIRAVEFGIGYPSKWSEYGSIYEILVYFSGSILFMLMVFKGEDNKKYSVKIFFIISYALIIFLSYRNAFTRQDGMHVFHGYVTLIIAMLLYVITSYKVLVLSFKTNYFLKYLLSKTAIYSYFFVLLIISINFLYRYPSIYTGKIDKLVRNTQYAYDAITRNGNLERKYLSAKSKILDEFPISDIDGNVLIVDTKQTIGFANDLNLAFMPVDYHWVYSQKSEDVNAGYFDSNGAPDYVLIKNIELISTGLLKIVENYKFYKKNNYFDQLIRVSNNKYNFSSKKHISTVKVGDKFYIPGNIESPIWAKIEINKTHFGELMSLLYKVPKLYMNVEFKDGSPDKIFPIIPDIVSGGFVLSWIGVENSYIFGDKKVKNKNIVKSIAIVGERDTSLLFDSNYKIVLSSMFAP